MPGTNLLGLDVGDVRVGVALMHSDVRVPIPFTTLTRQDQNFWSALVDIMNKQEVGTVVVGLPRGLDGQETDQTKRTREFVDELTGKIELPIDWQDEALTSVKADAELRSSGKPYQKADIDALAASFILSDYMDTTKAVRR